MRPRRSALGLAAFTLCLTATVTAFAAASSQGSCTPKEHRAWTTPKLSKWLKSAIMREGKTSILQCFVPVSPPSPGPRAAHPHPSATPHAGLRPPPHTSAPAPLAVLSSSSSSSSSFCSLDADLLQRDAADADLDACNYGASTLTQPLAFPSAVAAETKRTVLGCSRAAVAATLRADWRAVRALVGRGFHVTPMHTWGLTGFGFAMTRLLDHIAKTHLEARNAAKESGFPAHKGTRDVDEGWVKAWQRVHNDTAAAVAKAAAATSAGTDGG